MCSVRIASHPAAQSVLDGSHPGQEWGGMTHAEGLEAKKDKELTFITFVYSLSLHQAEYLVKLDKMLVYLFTKTSLQCNAPDSLLEY